MEDSDDDFDFVIPDKFMDEPERRSILDDEDDIEAFEYDPIVDDDEDPDDAIDEFDLGGEGGFGGDE